MTLIYKWLKTPPFTYEEFVQHNVINRESKVKGPQLDLH